MLHHRVIHKPTLPQRILSILTSVQPDHRLHYRVLAARLHHKNPRYVLSTCCRLAHDGRLQWAGAGMYRLPPSTGNGRPAAPEPSLYDVWEGRPHA
jgi:hypothetical protein